MNANDRNTIEHECARLLTAFYRNLDDRRNEEATAAFAEDGIWFRMGKPLTGADEIKQVLDTRFPDALIIHGLSNIHFSMIEAKAARSKSLVVVYAGKPGEDGQPGKGGLAAVTLAETEYVLTDAGWRIARHTGGPVMTTT